MDADDTLAARMAVSYRLVWLLVVVAWVSNYLVRMALPALLPPIIAELGLTYTRAGLLATGAFFYAYAVIQIPAGLLGDRFGRRLVVVCGLVAGAVASVFTGLAGGFGALLSARIGTGLAQGCIFSNDRAIIAAVTPRDKIALGQAMSFSGPGLGITVGLLLGGLLGSLMPWRHVFFVVAAAPLLAAILVLKFVPEPPRAAARRGLTTRIRDVIGQPDLWVLGLSGMAVMWAQYAVATWAPMLFMQAGVRQLDRAAFLASLQGVAGVVGLLVGGMISDRARRRGVSHKVVAAVGLVGTAAGLAAMALVLQYNASATALLATLIAMAVCAWAVWGPSFALLGEVFAGDDVSTAFGLYNTLCVLGAAMGPVVLGWARDVTGSFAAGCWISGAVALGGAVAALGVTPAFRMAVPRVHARV
jgi:predicted MFS family arabinose efflux permease